MGTAKRPQIKKVSQGKVLVELDAENKRVLLMTPDGQIRIVECKNADGSPNRKVKTMVEEIGKHWFKKHLGSGLKIGIGTIEWPKNVLEFATYLETCTCPDNPCMDGLHRGECPALGMTAEWPSKAERSR
jgi:hypothetical protein